MNLVNNIQFLRAIAALMVVMFHIYPYTANQETWIAPLTDFFMQVGYAGVDVFFVISGYVMWLSTQYKENVSVGGFVYNRLTRIYLGYWPYFFIILGLVYYLAPAKLADVDLIGSFFLSQVGIHKLLLQVAWTLTYELYFYAWFTVLLLLPRKWLLKAIIALFVLIVGIQAYHIAVNDMYAIERFPYNPFYLMFLTSPFCLEFLAGCMIASYFQHHRIQNIKYWVVAALLIFVSGYYYQHTKIMPTGLLSQGYYLPERVMFWGSVSVIVVAVLVELNLRGVLLWRRAAKTLGGASYSIYLSHIPLLFLLSHSGVLDFFKERTAGVPLIILLVLLVVLVYSVIHYLLIEKPLIVMAKRLWSRLVKANQSTAKT